RHIVRLAHEKPKPSAERLREYRDSELETLYLELYSPAPIYDELEIDRLESGLSWLAENFGTDDQLVITALGGKSPRARAEELVRGTKLKDVALRHKMVDGGTQAIAGANDALIKFAQAIDGPARAFRTRYEDSVESAEHDA